MSHSPEIRVIDDPETLRLIADPLRLRLLELLRREPRTVTELAELLEKPRTNLYYHIRLLEQHGLVAVAETRLISGIAEKRYRATAYRLSVDKSLLGPAAGQGTSLDVFLSFVLDEVASEITRAVAAGLIDLDHTHEDTIGPRRLVIGRKWYRFTDDEVAAFDRSLADATDPFADRSVFMNGQMPADPVPDARLYEFLTAFYPIVAPEDVADDRD